MGHLMLFWGWQHRTIAAIAAAIIIAPSSANAASKQIPKELLGSWRYYHPDPDSSTIDVYANKIRVGDGECQVLSTNGSPDLTTIVDEICETEDPSTGKLYKVKTRELYKLRSVNGLEILIVARASSSGAPANPVGWGFQPQILEYVRVVH